MWKWSTLWAVHLSCCVIALLVSLYACACMCNSFRFQVCFYVRVVLLYESLSVGSSQHIHSSTPLRRCNAYKTRRFVSRLQTAMKLWKESGDSEYVCWAAMAIHGQSPGEGPADALKLAEMLLKKPLDTVSVLYIDIMDSVV